MLPDLLSHLTGEWREALSRAGLSLRPPLTALKAGGARGQERKVNFLVFGDRAGWPGLILKLARSADYQSQLRREFEALTEVAAIAALDETTPKPVGLFEWNDHLVLAESILPGVPLSSLLRRQERVSPGEIREDLRRADDWVRRLHAATVSGTIAFRGRAEVEERLETIAGAVKAEGLPPAFIRNLLARADDCRGLRLPLAGCHGDFWPGNFLVAAKRVGVIDWEHFTRGQLPLGDVFFFITTYARTYPRRRWKWGEIAETFRYAFLENNRFAGLMREFVAGYLRASGLPESAAHLFFSLFLLDMADPAAQYGLRRTSQQAKWAEILNLYARSEKDSIFVE